jgi:antitoxin (DNA-binding transcriptional repressor) of toxin-antitoxin stability system
VEKAKIAHLKNHLSRYLAHVRGGGSVLVLDRERPVARLVPLTPSGPRGATERLSRLERQGLIRRGTGGRPAGLTTRKPARLPGGVLRSLLDERGRSW